MTHTFEIKETSKSKSLIAHLRTLTYVKHIDVPHKSLLTEQEMITQIRKAEKSKSISVEDAIKASERWIKRRR